MQRNASLSIAFLTPLFLGASALAQNPPPPLGPPPPPPPANPTTAAKVSLGALLFWDEQLSSTKTMACATCHIPERGGSDPRSAFGLSGNIHPGFDGLFGTPDDAHGSPGVVQSNANARYQRSPVFGLSPQVTPRKSPSAVNAAYAPVLFWDGRAGGTFVDPQTNQVVLQQGAALESQAVGPITSSVEMGHLGRTWPEVIQRVVESRPLALATNVPASWSAFVNGRSYPQIFLEVFGTNQVNAPRIAMAIAAYERTLFSNQAPIDAFFGGNPNALTQLELQGQAVFTSPQTGCAVCHAGNLFTNQSFQYVGVRPSNEDPGRFSVTGNPGDLGRMRVPSLRNVELRAPYFHTGSMATLEDVVDFYNRGGDFNAPNKNPLIRPLGLSPQQRAALVAFLKRPLTDPRVAQAQGPFEHPTLYVDSGRMPTLFGAPTLGSGGFAPRMVALSPALVGNATFTVGVEHGLGGGFSGLILDAASNPGGAPFGEATNYLAMSSAARIFRVGPQIGFGPGNGWQSFPVVLQSDPLLAGTELFGQWFVRDPGSGGRFSASAAFATTYFQ
ncbi:MAG: c-type cytochrome [Planctomycetes bacterium]|nr:c-type cytochrome [Planctomycetota bacterium]